jgi:hypothetical protein
MLRALAGGREGTEPREAEDARRDPQRDSLVAAVLVRRVLETMP